MAALNNHQQNCQENEKFLIKKLFNQKRIIFWKYHKKTLLNCQIYFQLTTYKSSNSFFHYLKCSEKYTDCILHDKTNAKQK